MVGCDKCPDKLRCTTGQVEECNRGFKLKMCCRKHLDGKMDKILKQLIEMPDEMITDPMLTYRDICPMCKCEVFVRLNICNSEKDIIKKLQEEIDVLRAREAERLREDLKPFTNPYKDTTEPFYPQYPPFIGDPPIPGSGTWTVSCSSNLAKQDKLMEENPQCVSSAS
jgi:hypothetical protein